jgi:signal-transduction protein with cAMP-binding, CBS, and nucleotidyltransferase domain
MKTGYKVCDAMTKAPIAVGPETSLKDCARIMAEKHVGALIIAKGKNLLGIITEQDIVRKSVLFDQKPSSVKVEGIMEKNMVTISPEVDLFDALILMRDNNIRHLPVMDNRNMIGLLTSKDILKIQPQLFEILAEKIELKEAENKPINAAKPSEGVCQSCGEYAEVLYESEDGTMVCENCRNE